MLKAVYTINFPAIAPSATHNFSVKTIEFKMAAVSVKRSIRLYALVSMRDTIEISSSCRVSVKL